MNGRTSPSLFCFGDILSFLANKLKLATTKHVCEDTSTMCKRTKPLRKKAPVLHNDYSELVASLLDSSVTAFRWCRLLLPLRPGLFLPMCSSVLLCRHLGLLLLPSVVVDTLKAHDSEWKNSRGGSLLSKLDPRPWRKARQ